MSIMAYFAICVFWGLSSIATKVGLASIEPFTFSFLRFLITGIVLLAYNLIKQKSIRVGGEDFKVIAVSATIMYFLNSAFLLFATDRLDAGLIPILFALVPVVMVVLETIIGRKMLVGIPGAIGIVGGIIGIAVVSFGNTSGAKSDMLGLLCMGLAVFSWAGGSVYLKNKKINTSITILLMYQTIVPLAFYTALVVFRGGLIFYEADLRAIGGVLYMAIVDTLLGSACYVYLLKKWKVSIVSTYAYINPVVGLLGSYLILGESLAPQKILGMVIILGSVFLIQSDGPIRKKLKRESAVTTN